MFLLRFAFCVRKPSAELKSKSDIAVSELFVDDLVVNDLIVISDGNISHTKLRMEHNIPQIVTSD